MKKGAVWTAARTRCGPSEEPDYSFVMLKPVTVASVLCEKRMP